MVAGLVAALLAPVTGGLFGLAYGTAIRIGYEQIYPALFPSKGPAGLTKDKKDVIAGLVQMYDIIGGKGAHEFGINLGFQRAMQGIGDEMFKSSALNQAVVIEAGIQGVSVQGGAGGLASLSFTTSQLASKIDTSISQAQQEILAAQLKATELAISAVNLTSQQAIDKVNKELHDAKVAAEKLAQDLRDAERAKDINTKANAVQQALIDAAAVNKSFNQLAPTNIHGAPAPGSSAPFVGQQFQPTGGSPVAAKQARIAKLQADNKKSELRVIQMYRQPAGRGFNMPAFQKELANHRSSITQNDLEIRRLKTEIARSAIGRR